MPLKSSVLVGNAFPLSLVRRAVDISPFPLNVLRETLAGSRPVSFWGHANTVAAASAAVGADLHPLRERPALTLDEAGYPQLEGVSFTECWILSPEYEEGFRPAIGEEVPLEKIRDWQALKIQWKK